MVTQQHSSGEVDVYSIKTFAVFLENDISASDYVKVTVKIMLIQFSRHSVQCTYSYKSTPQNSQSIVT